MTLPACLSNLRIPVVAAPLFIISTPELVLAQCKAGIIGSFPSLNARPANQFETWLADLQGELAAWDNQHPNQPAAPYAVNLIVHKSNSRLEQDLELCLHYKVPVVITSLGAREDVNSAIKGYGGTILHDVIDDRFAHKAIDKGAHGLIAVAAGAGGHAGRTSPFALVQEIRRWFDGPLILSGAISSGRSILAAQTMGADLAYIGSSFIATKEANASAAYKQAIVDSCAADIVYSNLFTGVWGNYLRSSITAAGLDPDNLPLGDASNLNVAISDVANAKAWRDVWGCGQGIAAVTEIVDVSQLIAKWEVEYRDAWRNITAMTHYRGLAASR